VWCAAVIGSPSDVGFAIFLSLMIFSFDMPAIVDKQTWQLAQRRMESQKARAEERSM